MYRIPASTATSHVPHRSKRPSHAPCAKRSPATTGRPISPMPRKSGSASSTRAPICCCGSTSRNAVRRPARSTTTAPYGPTPARSFFPPRRERLLLQLRMQLHRHAARRAPARPHAGGTCPRRSAAHRAATRDLSARSAAGNRRRQPLDADARNPRRRTVPRPARKVGRRTGCDEPLQMRRRPLVPALPLMAAGRNACARFPPPRVLRTGIFRTEKQ